jgi:hypothetical protein
VDVKTQPQPVSSVEAVEAPLAGSAGSDVSRLRALALQVLEDPADVERATAFNTALRVVSRRPTEALFLFIQELSADGRLAVTCDGSGRSCRTALIAAWLDLGYPWALQVDPEDVAFLQRSRTHPGAVGWAVVTTLFAIASALFNGLTLTVMLPIALEPATLPATVGFAAALVHAVVALVAVLQEKPRALTWVARAGWLAPLWCAAVAFLASGLGWRAVVVGLAASTPQLLTATAAWALMKRLDYSANRR